MMKDMMTVAAYIYGRYQREYNEKIDEMKLQKLMYFAQRESLIRTGEPLFEGDFYGWRFGPVLKELRTPYKDESFSPDVTDADMEGCQRAGQPHHYGLCLYRPGAGCPECKGLYCRVSFPSGRNAAG